ncbi:MAG: hypothetical protein Q4C25_09165 [Bacillota bacterium]|nr:hypothetical protein [Bacillota bacterium]
MEQNFEKIVIAELAKLNDRFDSFEARMEGFEARLDGVEKKLDAGAEDLRIMKMTMENDLCPRIDIVIEGCMRLYENKNTSFKMLNSKIKTMQRQLAIMKLDMEKLSGLNMDT